MTLTKDTAFADVLPDNTDYVIVGTKPSDAVMALLKDQIGPDQVAMVVTQEVYLSLQHLRVVAGLIAAPKPGGS